jgi:hypothetical protein
MFTANEVHKQIVLLLTERSQKQLAHDLGISTSYLNDYVHFRRTPGPRLLSSLGLRAITLYCQYAEMEKYND